MNASVQFVEENTAPVTEWASPPEHSTEPESGKSIYIVSIDQRLEGAIRSVDAVEEAAEILGWTTTLVDGQSDPNAMAEGVQRAVREGADGVILVYINQAQIPAAIKAARDADIPVVSILSGNEPSDEGVNADVGGLEDTGKLGEAQGHYVIAKSDGKAKVILFEDPSFALNAAISGEFKRVIEGCAECEIVETVTFSGADVVTKLPQLASTAGTRNPEADWAVGPYDAAVTSIMQGLRDAGRTDIKLVGTGGNLPNLEVIRSDGQQVMSVGQAIEWAAYTAVDNMARIMSGDEPEPLDAPVKILDADNLPPDGETWNGDFDYAAMFRQLWGR